MFDAYDPAFQANPYPMFADLRSSSPVFHDAAWGLTFFTRHKDVEAILRDRERFGRDFRHRLPVSSVDQAAYERIYPKAYPTWTHYIRESFIDLEPPRHLRLRRLVSKAFTNRAAETFRPSLQRYADALVAAALDRGDFDGIADFAAPIPIAAIGDLMGIRQSDREPVVEWSNAIVRLFDQNVTPREGEMAENATVEFVEYLSKEVANRRQHPGQDLISAMTHVEDSGDSLTEAEIVGTSILTLNAGHEATVHAIGNSLLALAMNPDQLAALPHSSGFGVDELLRYDTPLQMFERWVLEDVDDFSVPLKAGSKVGLLFGSANHDTDAFEGDTERLDVTRDASGHLSFSRGIHACVGAPLARLEVEVALRAISANVATMELTSEPSRIASLVFRGVESLPLELTRR